MKGNGGGEIVQVQGGHIIRATGRKDRHSKVYTAKGPRDRRVRLSAHTAIQFYDVQDRLGYDRPSKAVDWLIKKAKPAIDKLAELPPFDPNNMNDGNLGGGGGSSNMGLDDHNSDSSEYGVQLQRHMHTQSIHDTMKSFFPTTSVANSINYENYQTDMISRGGSQTQDLCLSLHTLQDRNLIHGQTATDEGNTTHSHVSTDHQGLFPGSVTMGFDSNGGWRDNQPPDIGQFSRLMAWSTSGSNGGGDGGGGGGGGGGAAGLIFNSLPMPSAQQGLFGQSGNSFAQRGTLQSSYSPSSGHAWDDLPDHHKAQSMHHAGADGFMGFYVPSGIHDGVVSNKDSASLSPNSSH